MNDSKFVETWRLMENYNFELICEQNFDYICTICKNLLINAHSGPCSCRFCLKCIKSYLGGNRKLCPGNTKECHEESLDMENNIHYEPTINREILKSVVKCPKVECEFTDELRNIDTHIRFCDPRKLNCPFFNIGCKEDNLVDNDMKKHLLCEIVPHSNLLLEDINNIRNELEWTKKFIFEYENENKRKKLEIESNQTKITELERNENISSEKIDRLNQKILTLENENKSMRTELTAFRIDQSNQTSKLLHQQSIEINEMKLRLKSIEIDIESIKQSDDGQAKNTNFPTTIVNVIDSEIKNLQMKISEIEKCMVKKSIEEFEWVIENFTNLQEQSNLRCSEPFYSHRNGYKVGLSCGFYVDGYFVVNMYLIRGKWDDQLPWPCRCSVTVDLINQNDSTVAITKSMQYGNRLHDVRWERPVGDGNGDIEFLRLPINDCWALMKRDQIIVKCKTEIY